MMIGLGVYLPFYMSLTAFLAPALSSPTTSGPPTATPPLVFRTRRRLPRTPPSKEQGLVVASGLLGGESIVGVILAFVSVGLSLLG